MPDFVTPALAGDWIKRLVSMLTKLRKDREDEVIQISDQFGDPEILARSYVDPDFQFFSPADYDENEPLRAIRMPAREWVNEFLSGAFQVRDGRHVAFVLSDAGMGKTSLLTMLKLTHLLSFWPQDLDFVLLKLGEDTLDQISQIKNKRKTVLLLDSLDEDPVAWGKIEQRLRDLLKATENFRQVIITCRTQFFPKEGKSPIEKEGKVVVEAYVCNLLYLSPFSNEQVEKYLRLTYPPSILTEAWNWIRSLESEIDKARKIVLPMHSLRMRPMLLAYIKDLMESELHSWSEFAVYETLVENWILREVRKQKAGDAKRKALWNACQLLAVHLQDAGERDISEDDLSEVVSTDADLTTLDVGGRSLLNRNSAGKFRFSHYTVQEFFVAHWLIRNAAPTFVRYTDQVGSFLVSWIKQDSGKNLPKLVENNLDVSILDLSGVNLSRIDLRGADLSGTTLTEANLRSANLSGTNFRAADLLRADLTGADLSGADLSHTVLSDADLSHADIREADLSGADISDTKLSNAKVSDGQLSGAQLSGAQLSEVFLSGAKIRSRPSKH